LLPLALGFIGIAVSGIQGSRASASICFDLFEQQLGTKLKSGAESFDLIETLLIKCLSEGMKSFPHILHTFAAQMNSVLQYSYLSGVWGNGMQTRCPKTLQMKYNK